MSKAAQRSLGWLTAIALAIIVLVPRLQLSFDLSAFLPNQASLTHSILMEQVRHGPASRLFVIGISGTDEMRQVDTARALQQALAEEPVFVSVLNGEFADDSAGIPAPIRDYHLIMRDVDFSEAALGAALQSRMQDLAFGGGSTLLELISRDPYLVTLDILESLSPAEMSGDAWIAPDGSAVLLAETAPASIDIAAQAQAIDLVRAAFDSISEEDGLSLDITGVGAFSVELEQTIRAEATLRSVLASVALLLVLLIVFRSPRLLLLSALPLATGFLAGLTLVALLFDTVHGITLAFGFTLLGIAVDYPLHLFSHARDDNGEHAMRRIWPTMRLGVASTVVAYLALVFSNSSGLAQLGLFTTGGVIVASLVTRTWLPYLLPNRNPAAVTNTSSGDTPRLSWLAAGGVLLVAVAVAWPRGSESLWDDNLSSLSPVAAERLAADQNLRSAAVTADLRYQLALHSDSLQELLEASETMDGVLAEAVEHGYLDNWQSISQVLPSDRTQQLRREQIPDPETLARRLDKAVAATPFRADAFDAFLEAADRARTANPLSVTDLASSSLRSWQEARLLQIGERWVSLVSLVQPQPEDLAKHIAAAGVDGEIIDFQSASVGLMRDYRNSALQTVFVAVLIIIGLLWWRRGQLRQTAWIGLTVGAGVVATIAVVSQVHGSLTVIHMVALLLVLGLGLDYALFLSRTEAALERRYTDRGVIACAASTTIAFAILASSSIPVLKFLGLTVAAGSLLCFATAWAGSRLSRTPS